MPIVDTIYRNPSRWRAVIHTNDVRHGTAGCLLSLVLLAPLFVRQLGMVTIATFVLIYSLVVVPALTNFFSPVKVVMRIARKIQRSLQSIRQLGTHSVILPIIVYICSLATNILESMWSCLLILLNILALPFICFAYCFLPCIHGFYLALEGFRVTSNQIVFFMLCEKLFSEEVRLVSLYFLFFFTVLAYLHKSLTIRQWSHSLYESNLHDFLKLTTWFIAVRLAKGVAMSFVLIIFTMQFNKVEPNFAFVAITFVYFLITQKKWTGNEKIVCWVKHLQIDLMEEEEELWVPFVMRVLPLLASAAMMSSLLVHHPLLCLIALYTNILVPFMLLKKELSDHIFVQSVSIPNFRKASFEEIQDSPTCPICLESMRVARVTPCNHVYHAVCLRRCISVSNLCPLCKQDFSV